ncbi:unnamed protein product [Somion occarium]|uniref:Uncharacterized protein n=1 Tax=Somion occarium TaxID=3059160 RepID=A0ABP1DN20_9APHY
MILDDALPFEKSQRGPLVDALGAQSSSTAGSSLLPQAYQNDDVADLPPPPSYDESVAQGGGFPVVHYSQQPGPPMVSPRIQSEYIQASVLEVEDSGGREGPSQHGTYSSYMGRPIAGQHQTLLPVTHSSIAMSTLKRDTRSAMSAQSTSSESQTSLLSTSCPTPDSMPHRSSKDIRQSNVPGNSTDRSQPFEPLTLLSNAQNLDNGFPGNQPSCDTQPHPFTTHAVKQEDWERFLMELREAGKSTTKDLVVSGLAGVMERLRQLMTMGLGKQMKCKRSSPIGEVIDRWNQEYFHLRSMDVVLALGDITCTGPTNAIPADIQNRCRCRNKSSRAHCDRASSEAELLPESGVVELFRKVQRAQKTMTVNQKLRRDFVDGGGTDERWRLVIAYKPIVDG